MSLKIVVIDLDDTLIDKKGNIVPGVEALVSFLKSKGIEYTIASNRGKTEGQRKIKRAGLTPTNFVTREDIGAKKGSPEFFLQACRTVKCNPEEGIYVGHTDLDMRTAVNARTIFLNAIWAGDNSDYGIRVNTPSELQTFIDLYLTKQKPWYAWLDAQDTAKRPVVARSLVDHHGAGNPVIETEFKSWLKMGFRSKKFEPFATNHFLSSLYLSGIIRNIDLVTVYPGHSKGTGNQVLDPFLQTATRLFHSQYSPGLLVRHTNAPKSAYARRRGEIVLFSNQTSTMTLSPDARDKVKGKTVLVIDDFLTEGNSFEWARNALLIAGAEKVVTASFGQYPKNYTVRNIKSGKAWDVFAPSSVKDEDFICASHALNNSSSALSDFAASYERYSKTTA